MIKGTVTESFFVAVPCIVLYVFADFTLTLKRIIIPSLKDTFYMKRVVNRIRLA